MLKKNSELEDKEKQLKEKDKVISAQNLEIVTIMKRIEKEGTLTILKNVQAKLTVANSKNFNLETDKKVVKCKLEESKVRWLVSRKKLLS